MERLAELSDKLNWVPSLGSVLFMAGFYDDGTIRESRIHQFLSQHELNCAAKRVVAEERRHFTLRRWFQRIFVAQILHHNAPLHEIQLVHQLDTRPLCLDALDLNLSFSTSGMMMLACGSFNGPIGIDIECRRTVQNAVQLARRFFSEGEAETLAALPETEQSENFLLHWTAKEAGLKAAGKGIDTGLNRFQLSRRDPSLKYEVKEVSEPLHHWSLDFIQFFPDFTTALVRKIDVD